MGVLKQWEVATGKLVQTFDAKALHTYEGGQRVDYGGVRAQALSADNKLLAAGGLYKATNPLGAVNEPLVLLFDWDTQKLNKQLTADGITGRLGLAAVLARRWFADGDVRRRNRRVFAVLEAGYGEGISPFRTSGECARYGPAPRRFAGRDCACG